MLQWGRCLIICLLYLLQPVLSAFTMLTATTFTESKALLHGEEINTVGIDLIMKFISPSSAT